MKNNYIRAQKNCRACKADRLLKILNLGNLSLAEYKKGSYRPPKAPLELVLCNKCKLLQLKHTVSPRLLYNNNYGYRSGINNTMKNELREIVSDGITKCGFKDGIVIDIGANDGTLLKYYPHKFQTIGVEPISKLAKQAKKHADSIVNNFFTYEALKNILKSQKAVIITAISCFYDLEDPNKFIADVVKILDQKGILIIQQNYLLSMLENNAFDNIVHEHLEYYSLTSLMNLLKKYNLEVFDVKLSNLNGGSFRTYIAFKNQRKISKNIVQMLKKEKIFGLNRKSTYNKFAKNIKNNKLLLNKMLSQLTKEGKTIFVYGASTRGNTLLQYYKLDNKVLKLAVERNKEKFGSKISSVQIPIISEQKARALRPDYLLVLPWFFREEFIKREANYLKKGGHLIFPLPKVEII